jgi:hypothetical protein
MDIRINGKTADIILESERTLGAVLVGIENWLGNSAFRVKGLEIDGQVIAGDAIPTAFERELVGIESIDVKICSGQELMLEALAEARCYLAVATASESPAAVSSISEGWRTTAAASFLSRELPDIWGILDEFFKKSGTGGGLSSQMILSLIEERIREIGDPTGEFARLESLVSTVSERLEELPIDIQTGKDGRAAETVSLFSTITEKLFRLFAVFQSQGGFIDMVDSVPIHNFLEEFGDTVKELVAAYSAKDAVLVGDLAEYELAPRLRSFYAALKGPVARHV